MTTDRGHTVPAWPTAGSAPAGSAPAGSAPAGSATAGSAPAGSAPAGIEREARTVAQVMVREPKQCGLETRVGELRRFFRDDHVRAALVVHDGVLVTVVEPEDIGDSELTDALPAAGLGRLLDRVVLESTPLRLVHRRMLATGQRRLAVIDDAGRLVGLLCLKRKRDGFCSDEDVWARAIAAGSCRVERQGC
jgi:CBS domain-containing protein